MLPNFLVIGPGRSGTTWMYHALKSHPQICVSSAKETLFFETEFGRGLDWYSRFFSHCHHSAKAVGEVSNTYFFCKEAPKRIKSVNPDMKLISCLRNPVERTFSHYLFLKRGGQIVGTFRETLDDYPYLIEKAKCYKHLKPYFEVFNRRQICIKLFEDLRDNQVEFIQSIYMFLDVDRSFEPDVDDNNKLSAAKPKSRYLALGMKKGARFMRRLGYPELISKIKYSRITNFLYNDYQKGEKPKINPEDEIFLRNKITADVEQLSEVLNIEFEKIWFE